MADFTTTEKLVVSRAVDMYGVDDEASVTRYIAAMYAYIHPCRWKLIYQSVLEAYRDCGYTSPVDFCEDLRFSTAKKMYLEKVALRNSILEGTAAVDSMPTHVWNLGNIEEIGDVGSQDECTDNRQLYSSIDPRVLRQHVEAMGRHSERTTDADALLPAVNKEKKRYYYRMTDEEKELDDFIDRVEEEDYNTPVHGSVAANPLRGKYPAMKTLLEKQLRRPETGARSMNLSEQYRCIMKKVLNTRKQAKDKSMWKQELRAVIRHYIDCVGMDKELERIDASIRENNMTHVVLSILMLLQETINGTRDEGLIAKCAAFKRNLASFNDYYRR